MPGAQPSGSTRSLRRDRLFEVGPTTSFATAPDYVCHNKARCHPGARFARSDDRCGAKTGRPADPFHRALSAAGSTHRARAIAITCRACWAEAGRGVSIHHLEEQETLYQCNSPRAGPDALVLRAYAHSAGLHRTISPSKVSGKEELCRSGLGIFQQAKD